MKQKRIRTVWTVTALVLVLTLALPFAAQAQAVPTISSNKDDYAPGEIVTLTGENWQAGEAVHIFVNDDVGSSWSRNVDVVAADDGTFTDTFQLPSWFVATYSVTARGASSGTATTTFTDAALQFVETGLPSGTSWSVTWNGVTKSSTTDTIAFGGGGGSTTASYTVGSVTGYTASPASGSATSPATGNAQVDITFTVVSCTAPSVATNPSSQTVVYGNNATFTAGASGNPAPTVQWQVSTNSGGNWADAGGATGTTLTISSPTVAMSGNQYRAVFSNECGGTKTATSNAATLTVTPQLASVTAVDASKTYGDADPASFDTTNSGFLAEDLGAGKITFSASRDPGEAVGSYNIIPSASDNGTGLLANYKVTPISGTFTINKKDASVTAVDASKTYGEADPASFAATNSGFLAGDLGAGKITVSASRAAGESAGTYAITPSASDNGTGLLNNYNVTYTPGTFTINKKAASVTALDASKYFGQLDPPLVTTNSGFLAADVGEGKITFSASRAAGELVGTYDITPSASDNGTGLLNNYNVTYKHGTFTILAWSLYGFYQPVDMPIPNMVWNTVKGGSTVPLKFEIFAGPTELTDVSAIKSFTTAQVPCGSANVQTDEIEVTTTGGTVLRYDWTDGQFIQNWKTLKTPGVCYRVTMTTQDLSSLVAYFKLK